MSGIRERGAETATLAVTLAGTLADPLAVEIDPLEVVIATLEPRRGSWG